MSHSQVLRALVTQRLTAAAEDICALFERTIAEYEQEVLLLTHSNSSQQQRPTPQQHQSTTGVPELEEQLQDEFHIVIVGTEADEDKSSVLSPEEDCGTEAGCSSDPLSQFHSDSVPNTDSSDHTHQSEDYGQQQAKHTKRSYAMRNSDLKPSCSSDRRPFSCPDCGRSFTRKSDLKRHMLVHTGEKPFWCPVCGKRFALKANCFQHMKVVHHISDEEKIQVPKPARPFSCSVCGEKFRVESSLKEHMKSHREEKPLVCSVCEESFLNESDFTRHKTCVHHLCPVCSERFNDRKGLNEHLRTHVDEGTLDLSSVKFTEIDNSFSCSECGKTFRDKSSFNRHMLVHTEERKHKCPVCERRFKHKCHLTQHLVLCRKRSTNNGSVGEKPHVCPDCGKSFLYKCSLGTHRKLHGKERPHMCSVCGEGFITKGHLSTHQNRSHPVCAVCKRRVTDEIELKAHLKTHLEDVTRRRLMSQSNQ